jgi:hypothetical protein
VASGAPAPLGSRFRGHGVFVPRRRPEYSWANFRCVLQAMFRNWTPAFAGVRGVDKGATFNLA